MLYFKEDAAKIFEDIQKKYNKYKSPVLIIAASDCDSICATRILTSLLQTENVSYAVHPVQSYRHVDEINTSLIQPKLLNDELHSLILINCGAMINLIEFLFYSPAIQIKKQEFESKRNERQIEILNEYNNQISERDIIDKIQEEESNELEEYIETIILPNSNIFNIYVIDSHRPFNLQNIYDTNNIICLLQGDDQQNINEFPNINELDQLEVQLLYGDTINQNEQDQDDDDKDDDDDDDDDSDSDMENNNNDGSTSPPRKRRRLDKEKNKNNNKSALELSKKQREREIRNYYRYSYYALHSSGVLYNMSYDLHKSDNESLWLAILGLTDQFVHEKIDREKYNMAVMTLRDEVVTKNPSYNPTIANNKPNASFNPDTGIIGGMFGGEDAENNNNNQNNHNATNINTMDGAATYNINDDTINDSKIVYHRKHGHIQFSQEFRFTLMRFWTLYDSMFYSRYIATKLGVWTDAGKDRLKYLMAKMALPLSESKQPFSNMKRNFKSKLPLLFEKHSDEFNLDEDISFGSFTKQHGSLQSISSADMVYAISNVLEADFPVNTKIFDNPQQSNNNNNQNVQGNNNNENQDTNNNNKDDNNNEKKLDDPISESRKIDFIWESNFWTGYDMISVNIENQNLLKIAIELAKERQKDIVDMGTKLIEKREIKSFDVMRYCIIDHKNRFQSPMSLCKLALFIIDAFRQHSKRNRPKAFVLASYNDRHMSYIVVGIPAKKDMGDVRKSPFGIAFQEATRQVKARVFHDSFEGSVMEVQKDDFKDWLETLHERLIESVTN